ncbi:glycosyltransferase, WecB/TagA/CpsF family [Megasphaera lornae]|uniref:Glycosyltransferase, WecB/TagA/CpsF family n=1 Tax=Megasphaera lornae TaxID=1000568 RepID=A0ABN0D3V5_9FIRM|nr:WecB/TagA/CpsF family glycosyltransferase [Megasphaera lornae]EGL41313.1 glycosyltransferase, WecB/TagA/CpsF family [Megasphaera lornae]
MDNTLDILSIPVANKSRAEVCAQVFSYIENHVPAMIATANAEMIMKAQTDRELATILRAAELVVPDGAGVLWAAEQQGKKFKERVTGVDLACSLLQEAAARQTPVYFLGGMPGIAARAAADIEKKVGKLQLVGTHSGFFSAAEETEIMEEIRAGGTRLLLVALGVPKQEKWIAQHAAQLGSCVCMGVGGTFDVWAGKTCRAPQWMQEHRLEWLYRLWKEPSRFMRMWALPQFVIAVKKRHRGK